MAARLEGERAAARFDVDDLNAIIEGGHERAERGAAIRALVDADDVLGGKARRLARFHGSHADQYDAAMAKSLRALQLEREHGFDWESSLQLWRQVDASTPLSLHTHAFLPTLRSQCDPEQRERWLPPAQRCEIIGCYAQTELATGSDVRGLRTTATFDPSTDTIVLNTPDLEATKWWPGALGRTATHAIVYARLLLPRDDGGTEDVGIHAFMLQIRALPGDVPTHKEHQPLPGIEVGDISAKLGYNGVDNGWLRLNKVRIPRTNMLMKHASLSGDGRYTKPPKKLAKSGYATMVHIRSGLVVSSATQLARAATIAVRYCIVRSQFRIKPWIRAGGNGGSRATTADAGAGGDDKTSVLDYPLVGRRVLPLLAESFALHFCGRWMRDLFDSYQSNIDLLPEVHAASAGLKALCTGTAADGIETARRALGGHGFSVFSGLGTLFADYVAVVTAEGDNFLLTLQTGRYLLKNLHVARTARATKAQNGSPGHRALPETCKYLLLVDTSRGERCAVDTAATLLDTTDDAILLDCLYRVAAWRVRIADEAVARVMRAGASLGSASASAQWEIHLAANAHCTTLLASSFSRAVAEMAATQAAVSRSLRWVYRLFALTRIEAAASDLLASGFFEHCHLSAVQGAIDIAMVEVRRDAVPLTDGWKFTDGYLNSALGRYDGKVYETMAAWADEEPLNARSAADETYRSVTRRILTGDFERTAGEVSTVPRSVTEAVTRALLSRKQHKAKL